MPQPPLVTVLMSVFNDSAYLAEAVASILNQTFTDFDFLIIDDGSTDGSSRFLNGLQDPRVRVIRHELNQGLTRSLKHGVELATGRYLARLDADDLTFADRLERQVAFLERNPDVVLLGGGCALIDEAGRVLSVLRQPGSDLEIRWTGLLTNPFVHSTVMVRRQVLQEHGLNYDESFQTTQDYDLWSRLLRHGRGANLDSPLIWYRLRAGVTSKRREQQLAYAVSIAHRTIGEELPGFALERKQVEALFRTIFQVEALDRAALSDWASRIGLYRRVLTAFGEKHGDERDWPRVRRNFASEVLRSAWRHRLPSGWLRQVGSTLVRDPFAGLRLLQSRLRGAEDRRRLSRECRGHS